MMRRPQFSSPSLLFLLDDVVPILRLGLRVRPLRIEYIYSKCVRNSTSLYTPVIFPVGQCDSNRQYNPSTQNFPTLYRGLLSPPTTMA